MFKNYGKFDERSLEKLCPWSLASTIPVLCLERVCPEKVGSWPWPRIFFEPLALASNVESSTRPLYFIMRLIYATKL